MVFIRVVLINLYLFLLSINSLPENINCLHVGCYIRNNKLNHVFFADDICLLAHSLNGLQDLVNMFTDYAKTHKIFFNITKSVDVLFKPKQFYVSASIIFLNTTLCLFLTILTIEELNLMLCYLTVMIFMDKLE